MFQQSTANSTCKVESNLYVMNDHPYHGCPTHFTWHRAYCMRPCNNTLWRDGLSLLATLSVSFSLRRLNCPVNPLNPPLV